MLTIDHITTETQNCITRSVKHYVVDSANFTVLHFFRLYQCGNQFLLDNLCHRPLSFSSCVFGLDGRKWMFSVCCGDKVTSTMRNIRCIDARKWSSCWVSGHVWLHVFNCGWYFGQVNKILSHVWYLFIISCNFFFFTYFSCL